MNNLNHKYYISKEQFLWGIYSLFRFISKLFDRIARKVLDYHDDTALYIMDNYYE